MPTEYKCPISGHVGHMTVPDVLTLPDYKVVTAHVRASRLAATEGEAQDTVVAVLADEQGEPVLNEEGEPVRRIINVDDWFFLQKFCTFELDPAVDVNAPPIGIVTWSIPIFWNWANNQIGNLGK